MIRNEMRRCLWSLGHTLEAAASIFWNQAKPLIFPVIKPLLVQKPPVTPHAIHAFPTLTFQGPPNAGVKESGLNGGIQRGDLIHTGLHLLLNAILKLILDTANISALWAEISSTILRGLQEFPKDN